MLDEDGKMLFLLEFGMSMGSEIHTLHAAINRLIAERKRK